MTESDREDAALLISRNGIPAAIRDDRQPREKQLAVYIILASTVFERIAFYALMNTLFATLQFSEPFHWNRQDSQTALFIFSGISYISTLIFAVISDAKVGTARTIIIGFVWYLFGYSLVTITVSGKTRLCLFNGTDSGSTTVNEKCVPTILGTLIFTAIGAGAVKSNLAVFGAQQTQESKITSRYFDKYAMAVNIGSMIAYSVIPYIQDRISVKYYYVPYLIAVLMLLLSFVLFTIGWRYYIHVKANETVVAQCIPVFINACQSWYKYKQKTNSSSPSVLEATNSHSLNDVEESIRIFEHPSTFLDFAKVPNGKFHDRIVDDVKSLRKAFIVFSLLIPYWFVYNQVGSTFHFQGENMSGSDYRYIASWVALGEPVTIIIGIFILNMFIYKYIEGHNREAIIITKFVIGMYFAVFTMCIAGVVEIFRQDGCHGIGKSDLLIYAQLPQNIFMGFSQLFAMVASYEFAYFAAPLSAQSLFMSLHFCSIGMPSLIGAAYRYALPTSVSTLDFSCPKNDKSWVLYVYFFILAGLQLLFILIFTGCQKKFRIVKLNRQQTETSQFL